MGKTFKEAAEDYAKAKAKLDAIQSPNSGQRWEYIFVTFQWKDGLWKLADHVGQVGLLIDLGENSFSVFNIVGSKGWELSHYYIHPDHKAAEGIFKRPKT